MNLPLWIPIHLKDTKESPQHCYLRQGDKTDPFLQLLTLGIFAVVVLSHSSITYS